MTTTTAPDFVEPFLQDLMIEASERFGPLPIVAIGAQWAVSPKKQRKGMLTMDDDYDLLVAILLVLLRRNSDGAPV